VIIVQRMLERGCFPSVFNNRKSPTAHGSVDFRPVEGFTPHQSDVFKKSPAACLTFRIQRMLKRRNRQPLMDHGCIDFSLLKASVFTPHQSNVVKKSPAAVLHSV
jgi:hypothetical protein